jgi:hypothetical protein
LREFLAPRERQGGTPGYLLRILLPISGTRRRSSFQRKRYRELSRATTCRRRSPRRRAQKVYRGLARVRRQCIENNENRREGRRSRSEATGSRGNGSCATSRSPDAEATFAFVGSDDSHATGVQRSISVIHQIPPAIVFSKLRTAQNGSLVQLTDGNHLPSARFLVFRGLQPPGSRGPRRFLHDRKRVPPGSVPRMLLAISRASPSGGSKRSRLAYLRSDSGSQDHKQASLFR